MIPREGGCQDASYNAWELRAVRRVLLKKALAETHTNSVHTIKTASSFHSSVSHNGTVRRVLVLHRTLSKFSQNLFDNKRRWSKATLESIIQSIKSKIASAEVDVFSDGDATLMSCISCQIRKFYAADVVIGVS